MSRGLSSANATAIAARHIRPISFVELQFDSGTLRLHNGVGTYSWGGNDWLGAGSLASMSQVEESDALSPYRTSYQLAGINSAILAEALEQEIFERLVIRYEGFLDENGQLVDDPHEFRRDLMDTMEVSRGGDMDWVTLHCESEHIRDTRAPGRMFSDEDQQVAFAGDTGFEYLAQMIEGATRVLWGPGGDRVRFGDPAPRDTRPRNPRGGTRAI